MNPKGPKSSLFLCCFNFDPIEFVGMMRRHAALVFLFFALFYIFTGSFRKSVQIPEEEYVLRVTSSLVKAKPLALPNSVPIYKGSTDVGKDGKIYSSYQIGQSLLYIPFYFVINKLISFAEPYDPRRFEKGPQSYETWLELETRQYLYLCPALLTALSCLIFFLFSLQLGFSLTGSLINLCLYGLGTMVWPYSKYLLTEASQNVFLLSTIYLLFSQKTQGQMQTKKMVLAGAAFGFLLSIRVTFSALLPFLVVYWFYQNRERRWLAPILTFSFPMVLFFLPQLAYDYVRFGNLFSFGYSQAGFSTPAYVGLFGYLFSPGKSFFLYNPVTILIFATWFSFFKQRRAEAILFSVIAFVIAFKYASWWVWSGNPCWGPRYLLVLLPFILLPVGNLIDRIIQKGSNWHKAFITFLFCVSSGVQILAVSVHYLYYLHYIKKNASLANREVAVNSLKKLGSPGVSVQGAYLETEFIPEYSPILGHWRLIKARIHSDEKFPILARWDLWVMNLALDGFKILRIKAWLGALTLIFLLAFVGRELFRSVLSSSYKDQS